MGRIFARYYLPTRTYHTLAKRDGIPKWRYAAAQPNQQWHIDFAETKLADGARVVVIVLIDDYSRFCVCCQVIRDMSSEARSKRSERRGRPSTARKARQRQWPSLHAGARREPDALRRPAARRGRAPPPDHTYWPEANGKAEASVRMLSTNASTTRYHPRGLEKRGAS